MGLGNFTADDEENSSNGGDARQYVQPSIGDLDEFFDDRDEHWKTVDISGTHEVVFVTTDFAPQNDNVGLLCYTTVDQRTGKARDKGNDAIRLVAVNSEGTPLSGEKKTLRITTWRKNLNEKIDSMMERGSEIVTTCDECGGLMTLREGEYGQFLGCSNYPECDNTEDYDGI